MVVIPFLIDKDNNMVIPFKTFSSYAVSVIVSYNFFKILYKLYFVFHHHSTRAKYPVTLKGEFYYFEKKSYCILSL